MSARKKHRGINQPSITYKRNRVNGASFDLYEFIHEKHTPTVVDCNEQSVVKSQHESTKGLTTREVISIIGKTWDSVNPLPALESMAKSNHAVGSSQKTVVLAGLDGTEVKTWALNESKRFSVDRSTGYNAKPTIQSKLGVIKVWEKLSLFEPLSPYTPAWFAKFLREDKGARILYDMEKIYGWMRGVAPVELKTPANVSQNEVNHKSKSYVSGSTSSDTEICRLEDGTFESGFSSKACEDNSDFVKSKDELLFADTQSADDSKRACALHDPDISGSLCRPPTLSSRADNDCGNLSSSKGTFEEPQPEIYEKDKDIRPLHQAFADSEKNGREMLSSSHKRSNYSFAGQGHAFAGAFAGIFVSLCLHPVDTVKTVIQSCHAEQKSICYIGRSIVSDRGVTGLYRGITTNIASSAPISAIYTFTYESVKGSLLHRFSKEYHSFAHCIAGGCASIATSFVFTPSERIKQQMQIGSHYHNCWNALIGIVAKGGLCSLYAGWGAVLCRNIPHSIIKFYTYENLKQWMSSSESYSEQPGALQTLVCGGLAGSTAALFSTPFDVVKTRLQTQIPGSTSQYKSVLHVIYGIGNNEGLKGLYRGLLPRLFMYMSQGALFFASYETLKKLFAFEVPQLNVQEIQTNNDGEYDSMLIHLLS